MSWRLIKTIQEATDLRLIVPFGLSLKLGDVISVGKDGRFTLEGTSRTLLDLEPGQPRLDNAKKVDLREQFGRDTSCQFRAAGHASTLFDNLPKANAGFDISFGAADGWILAVDGRSLASLDRLDRFRRPILEAYNRGVWKPDWALVTSIATVDRMTLLASRSSNTKIALNLSGDYAHAVAKTELTTGVSIVATNQQITQRILTEPMVAFCSGIRVRDAWWKPWDPIKIGDLGDRTKQKDPDTASDADFWENIDSQ
jgi:hypothetical protein